MAHSTLLRRVQKNLCTILVLTLAACDLILPQGLLSAAETKEAFSLQNVINKAQDLAKKPFQERQTQMPEFLLKMKYDEWREIRFDPEQALWLKEKLPFTLQFFHPGLYYTKTVNIYTVDVHSSPARALLRRSFQLRKKRFQRSSASQPGICRVSHPLPHQCGGLQGRSGRLSRCKLLPGCGQETELRPVRKRSCD